MAKRTTEELKKSVTEIKARLGKVKESAKDKKYDPTVRSVLKKLKRAQRKLGVISGSKLARRKKAAGASA